MYKAPKEFQFWPSFIINNFVKRRMRPLTISQVYRWKKIAAGSYLVAALFVFHHILIKEYKTNRHVGSDPDVQKAVDLNISNATIIKFNDFKIDEIIEYDRDDHPDLIEKRSWFAKH